MTNYIEPGLEAASKSLDVIDAVISKIEKYRKIKQDSTSYLRILYLEVICNIEILNTINFSQFDKIALNDNKAKVLFTLLQTDILESVFYKTDDNSNVELYEKLRKKGKVVNRNQELMKPTVKGDEQKVKGGFIYENILQAMSFVVVKINLLQKYSLLSQDDLSIIRPIRIKARLVNIYQRLLMIKNVMDQMDEIKEMAR
jgi:hypothetical protein